MSIVKVEAGQGRAVAILLIVLAAAVIAAIVRAAPPKAVAAASPIQNTTVAVELPAHPHITNWQAARNPFKKPAQFVSLAAGTAVPDQPPKPLPSLAASGLTLRPLPGLAVRNISPPIQKPASPAFTLLATVTGNRKLYAVIKGNDSKVVVVTVGDFVQGYKVCFLDVNRAILKRGKSILIAERSNSQSVTGNEAQVNDKP